MGQLYRIRWLSSYFGVSRASMICHTAQCVTGFLQMEDTKLNKCGIIAESWLEGTQIPHDKTCVESKASG